MVLGAYLLHASPPRFLGAPNTSPRLQNRYNEIVTGDFNPVHGATLLFQNFGNCLITGGNVQRSACQLISVFRTFAKAEVWSECANTS
jgi:hypothetical protein